jgi:hypothetical protein
MANTDEGSNYTALDEEFPKVCAVIEKIKKAK